MTIRQLIPLYMDGDDSRGWHGARTEYARKPGSTSTITEADNMGYALRDWCNTTIDLPAGDERATRHGPSAASRHLGDLEPEQVRPSDLRACLQHMVDLGLCRNVINGRKNRLLRFFRHLESYEYCEGVSARLKVVAPIKAKHPGVVNTAKIKSVSPEHVERTLRCARPLVRRAILVQLLCGMRPGELVTMRIGDLWPDPEKPRELWEYRPGSHRTLDPDQTEHKTADKGAIRAIRVGPEAQMFLREQITVAVSQGELADGEVKMPKLGFTLGDVRRVWPWVRVNSYAQCIARAADRAGVPHWAPNQLRHLRGTFACRMANEYVAAGLLGHKDPATTRQVYIDPDAEGVRKFVQDHG